MMFRNKPEKIQFARKLRKNPTPSEKKMWEFLKGKRMGVKFRRQSLKLGWIVDFYCPSQKLIVEIDGGYHQNINQIKKDKYRDETMLKILNLKTLRIPSELVLTNIHKALELIKNNFK